MRVACLVDVVEIGTELFIQIDNKILSLRLRASAVRYCVDGRKNLSRLKPHNTMQSLPLSTHPLPLLFSLNAPAVYAQCCLQFRQIFPLPLLQR